MGDDEKVAKVQPRKSIKSRKRTSSAADQVKDILNAIAPDDGSSESDEEDEAPMKRSTGGGRKRTQSAADKVKSLLDNIAPDDEDESSESDDPMSNIHKKRASQQSLVQSITSPQHNVGLSTDDDDVENEK